jgi:hypothetical protein
MNDNDYALKWAKKIRAVNLLGGKCKKCGESDILVLDFHHPGSKNNKIHDLLAGSKRWSEVETEVLKCELLCSNCHMEHHHSGNGRCSVVKASVLAMLGHPVCCECGKVRENSSSLDFHHNGTKKEFHISDVFARKCSVGLQALFDEIAKCKIVCRNCHNRMRINTRRFERLQALISDKVKNHCELKKIDTNAILEMKKEGKRVTDIATILGYAKSTVSTVLKRELG